MKFTTNEIIKALDSYVKKHQVTYWMNGNHSKNIKIIVAIGLMLTLAFPVCSQAQNMKDRFKQRKELLKMNKDMQGVKVSKESRKLAKEMKKEGWKVAPGALSLEQQIERSSLYQNMFEDDLVTPMYVWGDANSTAENYDAGKMQALELARLNLVGSIEANITQIVENNRDNKQLSAGKAASVVKTLNASKSFITQKLGQTIPVIDTYRELPNGNVIVRVQTFYSMEKARDIALDVVRDELEKEGENLGEELNQLLGE